LSSENHNFEKYNACIYRVITDHEQTTLTRAIIESHKFPPRRGEIERCEQIDLFQGRRTVPDDQEREREVPEIPRKAIRIDQTRSREASEDRFGTWLTSL
jgi:hypothetical protein